MLVRKNRTTKSERVKGMRLADRENSTQYSFYNGKAPTKTTTNGNYSCWNKVALPVECGRSFFLFLSNFSFSLFVFFFYNNFVVLSVECQARMSAREKKTGEITEISCMFLTSSTKRNSYCSGRKKERTESNNWNVIADSAAATTI